MMTKIQCTCGTVRFEAGGAPLLGVVCHCTSCRTAGLEFDARSNIAPVVDASGGCPLILWRKDRVRCVAGADRLIAHRLTPRSPTRRVEASCCQAPLFVDFTKGFWVSFYRDRVPAPPPPVARVMMGDAPAGAKPPQDGLPLHQKQSNLLMFKLLGTWALMAFRRPRIDGVPD